MIGAEHYRVERKSSWKHNKALVYPQLTALPRQPSGTCSGMAALGCPAVNAAGSSLPSLFS